MEAVGLVGTIGSAELVLPLKLVSASGYAGSIGTAELTLPIRTIEALGYGEIVAVAALTMPLKTMAAYGYSTLPETYRAWALNMKNAALTEYNNFGFNSFAVFNGVVLAANGDGIRALGLESDDDGDPINGVVRSGKMSYGQTTVKRVPRIYFAGSSEGDLEFSTINDQGDRYTYPLEANSNLGMQQRRVKVGRGQKSRYWQWEAANTDGGAFSVDAVIVGGDELSRRVG